MGVELNVRWKLTPLDYGLVLLQALAVESKAPTDVAHESHQHSNQSPGGPEGSGARPGSRECPVWPKLLSL